MSLFLLAFGCSDSFEALGRDDGGTALADGASFTCPSGCVLGAGGTPPPGFDAATTCYDGCNWRDCVDGRATERGCADAGVEPDASTTCESGWLPPREPVLFDASATHPVRAGIDGTSFVLAYLHGNPTPCDGACPGTMTVDPAMEGPFGVMPTYWSDAAATGRLDVRSVLGASLVTSISEAQVTWQWRPLRREGWQSDGTLALIGDTFENRTVVDVAPLGDHTVPTRTSRVAALHYLSAADALGYHDGLALTAINEAGSTVTYDALFPVGGVRDPRVVDGSTWIAALQNWDFPPTVQLVALSEPERNDIAGSSCGVASFDAVPTLEGGVVVVQDCEARSEIGGAVELEGRAGTTGRVTVSQRRSFVPSRAALLPTTGAIAVVVVEQGASAPTLTIVNRTGSEWTIGETIALPIAEGLRLPITSVDVAAVEGRPLIVTWTGTPADPDDLWAWDRPEAAYSVVERCP